MLEEEFIGVISIMVGHDRVLSWWEDVVFYKEAS